MLGAPLAPLQAPCGLLKQDVLWEEGDDLLAAHLGLVLGRGLWAEAWEQPRGCRYVLGVQGGLWHAWFRGCGMAAWPWSELGSGQASGLMRGGALGLCESQPLAPTCGSLLWEETGRDLGLLFLSACGKSHLKLLGWVC